VNLWIAPATSTPIVTAPVSWLSPTIGARGTPIGYTTHANNSIERRTSPVRTNSVKNTSYRVWAILVPILRISISFSSPKPATRQIQLCYLPPPPPFPLPPLPFPDFLEPLILLILSMRQATTPKAKTAADIMPRPGMLIDFRASLRDSV